MATVTGFTAARMLEIENSTVTGGAIDGSGHMILNKRDGTQIDMGSIPSTFPVSSATVKGIVELATEAEVLDGTDTSRAVTPAGLAAVTSTDARKGLVELATDIETIAGTDNVRAVTPLGVAAVATILNTSISGKQAANTNLTAISGLSPANDDILQRKAGAWTNRTPAQVVADLPSATTSAKGPVQLSTNAEVSTGTDASKAVTPAGLASLAATVSAKGIVQLATNTEAATGTDTAKAVTSANMKPLLDAKQALNANLTAISGLSPANDDILQRKAGAWTNRTLAQVATDLVATGEFPSTMVYSGSAYADADGSNIYIGTVDPGAVSNGSVWFDTTP